MHTQLAEEILPYSLSTWGLIKISGEGALPFLQGQLTCNVEKIQTGSASLAAHCNPQGRVISLFYIFFFQEAYYLLLPRNLIDMTLKAFKKYAVFYRIAFTDITTSFTLYGYQTAILPEPHEQDIVVAIDSARYVVVSQRSLSHTDLHSPEAWHLKNIEEGIPTLTPSTSGRFLPHELNLPLLNAVDFEKGCYTGQEIIARIHYRGKIKNKLYRAAIQSDAPPLAGADIYSLASSGPCGTLIDAALMHHNHYAVLLLTDSSHAKNQTIFLNDKTIFFNFNMEQL